MVKAETNSKCFMMASILDTSMDMVTHFEDD